jgi:hypothetical protein
MSSSLGLRIGHCIAVVAATFSLNVPGVAHACDAMYTKFYACQFSDGGGYTYQDCELNEPCSRNNAVEAILLKTGECDGFPYYQCNAPSSCQCDPFNPGCRIGIDCEIG